MKRFVRPAVLVLVAAAGMFAMLTWAVISIVNDAASSRTATQETLTTLQDEIMEHRSRDLRHLCTSELHHHASLEAIISVARQAGIDVDGYHVDVDASVAKSCEDSAPAFAEELKRIHRQARTRP